jgi:hypothetical protein
MDVYIYIDDIMEMMKRPSGHIDLGNNSKSKLNASPKGNGRLGTSPDKESKLSAVRDAESIKKMSDKPGVPSLKRRNSTGTIYIDSTMGQQDNESTIKCVCAVIRAHLLEAEREGIEPRPDFDTFKDVDYDQKSSAKSDDSYEVLC